MHPNIVLVAVVLATTFGGFGPGVVWAFVAGLTANLLGRDPLGSVPLALLLVAAGVAGGNRLFGRLAWAYPVLAVLLGSIAMDIVTLGVLRLVDASVAGGFPGERILTAALLNAGIAALLVVPARLVAARVAPEETVAW